MKGRNCYVKPKDCHDEAVVFKQVKTFWCPLIWLPPKRLVWIYHCKTACCDCGLMRKLQYATADIRKNKNAFS